MSKWLLYLAGAIFCITVILWHAFPVVRTIFLIARVSPYEQTGVSDRSVLIIGDSTGYGTGASQSKESIAGLLGGAYPTYRIKNNSSNGRTIKGALQAIGAHRSETYDFVLLQVGANDILSEKNIFDSKIELQSLLQSATAIGANVVMMSGGNIGGAPRFSGDEAERFRLRSLDFYDMYKAVCAEYGVLFIDLYEEPATDPFVQNPALYTSIDGLHPSSDGYAYWFAKLQSKIDLQFNR